jgi:uncharacterized protein
MSDPDAGTVAGHFAELSRSRCDELLTTTTVGRIGFAGDDGIEILPVNFVYTGSHILIRTSPYGPLAQLAGGVDGVAFEIDYRDKLQPAGWSVLVKGRVDPVDPDSDIATGELPRPWAPGTRTLLLQLTPRSVTGRAVKRS